jgi:hypothetical protein
LKRSSSNFDLDLPDLDGNSSLGSPQRMEVDSGREETDLADEFHKQLQIENSDEQKEKEEKQNDSQVNGENGNSENDHLLTEDEGGPRIYDPSNANQARESRPKIFSQKNREATSFWKNESKVDRRYKRIYC